GCAPSPARGAEARGETRVEDARRRIAQRGGGGAVGAPMEAPPAPAGPSRHPARRRRIEAETVPPPPRTAVSGHAPGSPAVGAEPWGRRPAVVCDRDGTAPRGGLGDGREPRRGARDRARTRRGRG